MWRWLSQPTEEQTAYRAEFLSPHLLPSAYPSLSLSAIFLFSSLFPTPSHTVRPTTGFDTEWLGRARSLKAWNANLLTLRRGNKRSKIHEQTTWLDHFIKFITTHAKARRSRLLGSRITAWESLRSRVLRRFLVHLRLVSRFDWLPDTPYFCRVCHRKSF